MTRFAADESAARAANAVQRKAADPGLSCALRAAAGSGKTRTLVDRIVRLFLAGARPPSVVAVTFTRKAAHEIKERLLERLRRMAAAPPDERRLQLHALLDRPPTEAELELAATLYDRVLEDLPGLPIGTIHSFCHRLLARFADEFGLDPSFSVLERIDDLWQQTLARIEHEAVADDQDRRDLACLGADPPAVRKRLTRLLEDRPALERWLERAAQTGDPDVGVRSRAEAHAALCADLRHVLLAGSPLEGHDRPAVAHLLPLLREGAQLLAEACRVEIPALEGREPTSALSEQLSALVARSQELVERVAVADDDRERAADLAALRETLLVKDGKRGGWKLRDLKGSTATKREKATAFARAAHPLLQALALADALELLDDNSRLLRWGLRALDIYDELKRRERCLDFHDLENLARRLLNDGEQAPYVQYRLDARIDHLLVDEFQDTSAGQWQILQPLAAEFLAGEAARGGNRTLFFVGDVKQSIYRWRDAAPELFAEVEMWLAAREGLCAALPTNFRSLPAIVETVKALFGAPPLSEALPPGEAVGVAQLVARAGEGPGEVWILPPFAGAEGAEAVEDAARATAAIVSHAHTDGRVRDPRDGRERAVHWNDILVLCRDRRRIAVYEQELRAAGIPTAPAGRGALACSREAQDILQLLRWLTFPGDDVALATVLRSPLFRVSEASFQQALSRRPPGRSLDGRGRLRRALWTSLRRRRLDFEPELARAIDMLEQWRRRVGLESPHELLRRIYGEGEVLARFAAAGGEQARYNLVRLLDLALDLETDPVPTLRGLVDLIARAAETFAAEEAALPEQDDGRVRLMTVHAAKGLEAPIVLLVDAASPPRATGRDRLAVPGDRAGGVRVYDAPRPLTDEVHPAGGAAWPGHATPPGNDVIAAAFAAARAAARTEEANILYVAMTRARDKLYVLGSQPARGRAAESPLSWLEDACAAVAGRDPTPKAAGPAQELSPRARPDLPARFASPPALGEAQPHGSDSKAAAVFEPIGKDQPPPWKPPQLRAWAVLERPSELAHAGEETTGCETQSAQIDHPRSDTYADAVAGNESARRAAAARGETIHLALRMIAEAQDAAPRDNTGPEPGSALFGDGDGGDRATAEAVAEARAVAGNPTLAWVFDAAATGARGHCEVPIIRRVDVKAPPEAGTERRVYGIIDRLLIWPDRAAVIDYKSNRVTAADALRRLSEVYRPQLAAYRAAVETLCPHLRGKVTAHILFTHPRDGAGRQGLLVDLE